VIVTHKAKEILFISDNTAFSYLGQLFEYNTIEDISINSAQENENNNVRS